MDNVSRVGSESLVLSDSAATARSGRGPRVPRGGCQDTAEGGALGNTTKLPDIKSASFPDKSLKNQEFRSGSGLSKSRKKIFESFDSDTGEVVPFEYNAKRQAYVQCYDEDTAVYQRWALLTHSRKILSESSMIVDRAKVYDSPYTDLTHLIFYTNLKTKKLCSYSSHKAGMPVIRKKRNKAEKRINKAPVFRTINCYRQSVPSEDVEIWRKPDTKKASFHNVGVCGSVWNCPVCSTKINAKRRVQIKDAYEAVSKLDGSAYMLTFTIKHGFGDSLDDLTSKFKEAYDIMSKSYAFKDITRKEPLKRPRKESMSFLSHIGRVTSLEVTYGKKNGWHPHEHQLWFFERDLKKSEITKIQDRLFDEWKSACVSVGLPEPLKWLVEKDIKTGKVIKKRYLALDIRKALTAEEYLTKFSTTRNWGIENELANSNAKKAKKSGRTPFQLLEDSMFGDDWATKKFIEFAYAFKGKHQIQFSRKLKAFLKDNAELLVDDSLESDVELAASTDSESEFLMKLTRLEFEIVVDQDLYSKVLIAAKHYGIDGVYQILDQYDRMAV